KFASEIDSSSKNIANDMRSAAQSFIDLKGSRLSEITYDWKRNDPVPQRKAADHLGIAVLCSREIATAASCLGNTIKNGKRYARPECTSKSLQQSATCASVQ